MAVRYSVAQCTRLGLMANATAQAMPLSCIWSVAASASIASMRAWHAGALAATLQLKSAKDHDCGASACARPRSKAAQTQRSIPAAFSVVSLPLLRSISTGLPDLEPSLRYLRPLGSAQSRVMCSVRPGLTHPKVQIHLPHKCAESSALHALRREAGMGKAATGLRYGADTNSVKHNLEADRR